MQLITRMLWLDRSAAVFYSMVHRWRSGILHFGARLCLRSALQPAFFPQCLAVWALPISYTCLLRGSYPRQQGRSLFPEMALEL